MNESSESGKPRRSFLEELKRRHVVRVGVAYVVTSWLLLQLGDILFPAFGAPAWAIRLLFGFLALGFPVALLLAWAFEMTPDGVRRTVPQGHEIARAPEVRRRVGRTLNVATIAVLVLAVAVLAWRLLVLRHAAGGEASARSVAVLPFESLSGDSANQYFSDGLSEDLIIALSQSPGLRVIGRESSFQFRGRDLDSKLIGSRLGVSHLLEGSVSREGGEVRLRAELVNTADGSTLWSQTYDRPYRHLFALQDDLTKAVATALEAKLMPSGTGAPVQTDRPPSGSLPAYNAYLEGNFHYQQLTEAGLRQAIAAYRKAVQLDPRYAVAWARLSSMWSDLAVEYSGGAGAAQVFDSAWTAVDSALTLDPHLGLAYLARGQLLRRDSLDWRGSKAALRKAVQLAPADARPKLELARVLAILGRTGDAVALQGQLVASDPLDALRRARLGYFDLGLGRIDDGLRALRRAVELEPTAWQLHALVAQAEVLRGDTAAAIRAAAQEPAPQWRLWALALAREAAGDTTRAQAALRTMIAKYGHMSAYQIAEVYASWGEPARAFVWLDRAWQERDPGISYLLYDAFMRPYRNDPRFAAFCRKIRLPVPGAPESGGVAASRS